MVARFFYRRVSIFYSPDKKFFYLPSTGGAAMPQITSEDDATDRSAEELLGEAEPWESWETALVGYSLAIGFTGVVVLGWLVNKYILS